MKCIYKYKLGKTVLMPINARIIRIASQEGVPKLWAEVNTGEIAVTRHFELIATGVKVPDFSTYVGSFEEGPLIWHIYELHNRS